MEPYAAVDHLHAHFKACFELFSSLFDNVSPACVIKKAFSGKVGFLITLGLN